MAKPSKTKQQVRKPAGIRQFFATIKQWYLSYWRRNWFHKVIVCLVIAIGLFVGGMYGIARWYIASQASKPLALGATFIPDYAQSFGLNPMETLDAMLSDLNIKHLRLVGYWDKIESTPGTYNFDELDSEFAMANEHGAKVSLSLGLRQPRWPECHMPGWAMNEQKAEWEPQLNTFIQTVVERYKNNPALDSYQLENEYFLKVFGICPDFSRDRLINEFNLVKKLDPNHTLIISRSNNALGTPINEPTPDEYGVSVYKRVWDTTITKRYVEYPFPAWFYGFLAGTEKIVKGKDTVIHEMQAEPWTPNGKGITETSLNEQNKSLDAQRFLDRIKYSKATGIKHIDLWGAEYWYYRKVKLNQPDLWNIAKEQYKQADTENAKLQN
jgi:hypothetical protein